MPSLLLFLFLLDPSTTVNSFLESRGENDGSLDGQEGREEGNVTSCVVFLPEAWNLLREEDREEEEGEEEGEVAASNSTGAWPPMLTGRVAGADADADADTVMPPEVARAALSRPDSRDMTE